MRKARVASLRAVELVWIVPCLAAVGIAVVLLAGLREIERAAAEVGTTLRRLDEVRASVAELRTELDAAGRSVT